MLYPTAEIQKCCIIIVVGECVRRSYDMNGFGCRWASSIYNRRPSNFNLFFSGKTIYFTIIILLKKMSFHIK